MKCPYCGFLEDHVLDSRTIRDGEAIKRRRGCLRCERRFTTYEEIEELRLQVIKKDGRREPFDRTKILGGLQLACQKRPVSADTLELIVEEIERASHDTGEREIASAAIGEQVMAALRQLDTVAYVRFASVYRNFQDATQFREIVDVLHDPPQRPRRRGNGREVK
jgi:transcriptional repressor NrdR